MEGFLVNYYEYHFLYINGIEHVESKSIQGAALIKLAVPSRHQHGRRHGGDGVLRQPRPSFHAGRNRAAFRDAVRCGQRPGRRSRLFRRERQARLKDLQDAALFRVRPLFATLAGRFGAAAIRRSAAHRSWSVPIPDRLRAYNMSPEEIVTALTKGNAISPSGNVRFGDMIPMVPVNSVVGDIRGLGDVPIRSDGTRTIFIRDIGTVEDSSDIETGYAIVNGRRTVYIPVTKRADASTLSVVNLVKENLPKFQSVLPEGVKVSYQFDQSPYVTRAIRGPHRGRHARRAPHRPDGVAVPARLAKRRSSLSSISRWRSWQPPWRCGLSGQTVNLMTLGGLALAVGILVDEGTVVIENVHSHLGQRKRLSQTPLSTAPWKRSFPISWRCCASWRCSLPRSSCRARRAIFSSPWRLRSASP